jgi:hypothetical protein
VTTGLKNIAATFKSCHKPQATNHGNVCCNTPTEATILVWLWLSTAGPKRIIQTEAKVVAQLFGGGGVEKGPHYYWGHYFPIVAAPDDDDGWWWVWSGRWMIGRGNRSTRRKPAPVQLCPPQIPPDLTRVRTRGDAVWNRRLTTWATARLS